MATYTIVEINDGGDPECDIDTTIVRCLEGGVETKITRVVYSRAETRVRFEFSNSDGFADPELMCGKPCTAAEWNEVLAEFKEAVAKLPPRNVLTADVLRSEAARNPNAINIRGTGRLA